MPNHSSDNNTHKNCVIDFSVKNCADFMRDYESENAIRQNLLLRLLGKVKKNK